MRIMTASLDRTAVLYGSGMSDGNVHNNLKVPVMVVGGKTLGIRGNRHTRYPDRTPLRGLLPSFSAAVSAELRTMQPPAVAGRDLDGDASGIRDLTDFA